MAKLYFIFLLCALASAENPSHQHPGVVSDGVVSRTSVLKGVDPKLTSYVSQSGAVQSRTDGSQSYTHHQALEALVESSNPHGRTGKDHNGLSENEVNQLVAENNRRRLQVLYSNNRNRPLLYKSLYGTKPYVHPLFGRTGGEADPNSAQNPGAHVNADSRDGSEHPKGDSSLAGQDPEASRRFYYLNGYNNPFDPYAELNAQNYLQAFGQYGNYLN